MKVCGKCKFEKDISEFNKNAQKPDGLQVICRECSNKRSALHYRNNKSSYRDSQKKSRQTLKQFVLDYLSTHTCVDCPETDPIVLDFDHITNDKTKNISEMIHSGVSIDTLKLEITKCEVRCANCHRRKTAKQFGWFKLSIT